MKTLLLWLFAPRYWRDMPTDKPGKWDAIAISRSPFRAPRELEVERGIIGLRRAYKRARWLALKLDWRLFYADGELGVDWAVKAHQE